MKTLKNWQVLTGLGQEAGIGLLVDQSHHLIIQVLEVDLFRVLLKKRGEFSLSRTWSITPKNDVAIEGRQRDSREGFTCPSFTIKENLDTDKNLKTLSLETSILKVVVHQPLYLEWFYKINGKWQLLVNDRKTGAYELARKGSEITHFQQRYNDEQFYGLGEKAGDLNRVGRRFEMRNLDAMGYDASSTDPLYKHIPFTITRRQGLSFGMFYDNLANCHIDLGNELDNYHAYYRKYSAEAGDLDYYFFAAERVLDVTKTFVKLTGKTFFGPKWSLGYSGSTMHYTDAHDAQVQLQKFITLCQQHDIPCDSFQLSSGYTSIANKRYVFHWNTQKIPDAQALSTAFNQAGIKLAANIKPCLLQDHPQYNAVAKAGLFIKDSEQDAPERSVFWDDEGSHLDFTNPKTIQWWQDNITKQLLEKGISSTWNDNNEYEIWDRDAVCYGFGTEIPIKLIRPLMPLLMMRASQEAQLKFSPSKRPYLISRSGCAGMQRYVQTWTGDNRTNWTTLRYNIRMGLGMSLSGLYNIGHDVGGFAGNRPDPELFVRWVQNGVMHPRFTIHSWNDDKTVNEPWMYPQVLPIIQAALRTRYQLLPYFYHLLWLAHTEDEPMLRPTFLDHEEDANTFNETDDFMLGRDLLVASVVEQGARKRQVYLPKTSLGWYCYYSHQWFASEQTIELNAPLERLPLLVKAGAILPWSQRMAYVDQTQDNQRQFMIFPALGKAETSGSHFEDDGESFAWEQGHYLLIKWKLRSNLLQINLEIECEGDYQPAFSHIDCLLPRGESRPLLINGKVTNVIKLY